MTSLKSMILVGFALGSITGCYTISLRASSERATISAGRDRIARDVAEIRLLRAELRTRSRLPELQRWNEQVLALAPPRAEQLMTNTVMLASYASSETPATVATVVRDAPSVAPLLHQASFAARTSHDLVADAALAGTAASEMRATFRQVALR